MTRDEWIANRIHWKARGYTLPAEFTHVFPEVAEPYSELLTQNAQKHNAGVPVLAFTQTAEHWTLLATQKIISQYDDSMHLFDLATFDDAKPDGWMVAGKNPKQDSQYLDLMSVNGPVVRVWAPPGAALFALWNILRMFPFNSKASGPPPAATTH